MAMLAAVGLLSSATMKKSKWVLACLFEEKTAGLCSRPMLVVISNNEKLKTGFGLQYDGVLHVFLLFDMDYRLGALGTNRFWFGGLFQRGVPETCRTHCL